MIISGATGIAVANSDASTFAIPTYGVPTLITQDFAVSDNTGLETWNVEVVDTASGGSPEYSLEATVATPEPSSLGLLGVASLGLLRRRRCLTKA